MNNYQPAKKPTLYFIGVTTGNSSINEIFPFWAKALDIDAELVGVDFAPNEEPEKYRQIVEFIKSDPLSRGALVTTHKINLLKASEDLFDGFGEFASILGEVSCIAKEEGLLWGHTKDPITSGIALRNIIPANYFRQSGAQMLVLGAGGSALALTFYFHNVSNIGGDLPTKIIVTDIDDRNLHEMKTIHKKINFAVPIEYIHVESPESNDSQVAKLPAGSLVINATGVGKDLPGSPLSDEVEFPTNGILWEFNYRGERRIMEQVRRQQVEKNLSIEDGWVYFLYGWIMVISEVFHLDIPVSGDQVDHLIRIANGIVTNRQY